MIKKKASVSLEGTAIPKLTLTMPITAAKAAAIKRCLENGELKITVSKVDLKSGKIADAYIYD